MAYRTSEPCQDGAALDKVLDLVQKRRGIDFRLYRATTIQRRALGRMQLAGVADYSAYLELLARDDAELERLVAHLTIKVGRFWRDKEVFALLRDFALPALRAQRPGKALHVWSAGCGNGEEAYSLAMLLSEGQGAPSGSRVVGTDVDRGALACARAGHYRPEALVELSPQAVAQHFEVLPAPRGTVHVVGSRLRACTQVIAHDLSTAETAPFDLKYDLICCRNVLIYFGETLQRRVGLLLTRSLSPGGFLCLGEAEWLLPEMQEWFAVVDRRARLFRLKDERAPQGGRA